MLLTWEKIPGSPHLHNFNVRIPECGAWERGYILKSCLGNNSARLCLVPTVMLSYLMWQLDANVQNQLLPIYVERFNALVIVQGSQVPKLSLSYLVKSRDSHVRSCDEHALLHNTVYQSDQITTTVQFQQIISIERAFLGHLPNFSP